MKRVLAIVAVVAMGAIFAMALPHAVWAEDARAEPEVKKPADRVVVMYFHRTQRCPTCLRMGSYSEEAAVKGFAKEIKDGAVEFHYVDFQDPKNAELTKGYKITGPALVVVKVVGDKAVAVKNLTEIWTKNREKDVFLKYVRDNVRALEKPLEKTASKADVGVLGRPAR